MDRRGAVAGLGVVLALVAAVVIVIAKRSAPTAPERSPSAPGAVERTGEGTPASPPEASAEAPPPGRDSRPTAAPRALALTGRVESTSGDAIAGADVAIVAVLGEKEFDLGRTASGAGGTFSLDLAALAALEPGPVAAVQLHGRARAARFRSGNRFALVAEVPWPLDGPVAASSPIVLEPGATVRGRVVDSAGAPVDEASVVLGLATGESLSTRSSDPLGEFELPVDVRGDGAIRVEKEGAGAATVAPIALAPDEDVVLGDVRLPGGSTIAGVVVYTDDAPVAGIEVLARHESLPADVDRSAPFDPAAGPGIRLARKETDPDGRFAFAGLASGTYALELPDLRLDGDSAYQFSFAAGVTDARLVVDWHRLRVRVLTPDGKRLDEMQIMAAGWTREHEPRFREAEESGDGAEAFFDEADFGRGQGGGGDFELFAPRGGFLLIRAKPFTGASGPTHLVDRSFEVPATGNESVVDLTLEAVVPGRLRLAMRDERGRDVTGAVATLRSKSGFDYAFIRDEPDEDGFLPPAVAGEYVLEVEPGAPLTEHYLPVETEVVVASGRDTTVPLVVKSGGRLRLTLAVPGTPRDGEKYGIAETVELAPADGSPPERVRAFFLLGDDGGVTWGTGMGANEPWLVGSPLAAGAYRVRVTASGFEDAESPFTLEAGRTTDVTLELKRRE